jgi:hypothetical protein
MLFRNSKQLKVAMVFGVVLSVSCSSEKKQALAEDAIADSLMANGIGESAAKCAARIQAESKGEFFDDDASRGKLQNVIDTCLSTQSGTNSADDAKPEKLAFVEPQRYGDNRLLDSLWDQCKAGKGSTCDELFSKAPVGSEYEKFGLNCGDRSDILHCSDLDKQNQGLTPENAAAGSSTTAPSRLLRK